MFTGLEIIQIDMIGCRIAIEEHPDDAPCDVWSEDIVARAIKEYFSDCEEWSDNMLPGAMAWYKEAKAVDDFARDLACLMVGARR